MLVAASNDAYLDYTKDSFAVDGSEIKTLSMALMTHYDMTAKSTQEVWTDDVPRLTKKYEQLGIPMNYVDLTQMEGKIDLSKGEKTTGQCSCGAVTFEINDCMGSGLCHCQGCSTGLGMCPVLLFGSKDHSIKGEENLKLF